MSTQCPDRKLLYLVLFKDVTGKLSVTSVRAESSEAAKKSCGWLEPNEVILSAFTADCKECGPEEEKVRAALVRFCDLMELTSGEITLQTVLELFGQAAFNAGLAYCEKKA